MNDEPVGISVAAIRNGLIASAGCWAFIIGLGYIGWRVGQLV